MRAVAVAKFRAPPSLIEIPPPRPATGELGVRLEYAGVNPFDWKIADGLLTDHRPHVFPLVLGVDGAGVVEQVGPAVRRFRVGDRVFGQFLHDPVGIGTYAGWTTVPESIAVNPTPAKLSSAEAAALPTAGMTALHSLEELALPADATLLVVGASGGVGSFAIPLARSLGLRPIAVARAASHPRLRTLGAVETIDPADESLEARMRTTAPQGVDALLDLVGPATAFAQRAQLVRRGGVAATTVYAADPSRPPVPGVRAVNIDLQPNAELLERLTHRIESGPWRVPVERTVPLEDAPAIIVEGRAGRLVGKTVLRI